MTELQAIKGQAKRHRDAAAQYFNKLTLELANGESYEKTAETLREGTMLLAIVGVLEKIEKDLKEEETIEYD